MHADFDMAVKYFVNACESYQQVYQTWTGDAVECMLTAFGPIPPLPLGVPLPKHGQHHIPLLMHIADNMNDQPRRLMPPDFRTKIWQVWFEAVTHKVFAQSP